MEIRPLHAAILLVPLLLASPAEGVERESAANPSAGRTGVYHLLRRGQTLYSLSRAYGVSLDAIIEANHVTDPTRIPADTLLFVPGAIRPLDLAVPEAPLLAWPVAGRVTSPFASERRRGHEGIDIGGRMGQKVRAAAAGRVLRIGTRPGYGKVVEIDHGGGITTRYAHLRRILVEADDRVETGDTIGEVGRSGNARGAHLHFEVRRGGRPVDPVPLLRARAAGKSRNR